MLGWYPTATDKTYSFIVCMDLEVRFFPSKNAWFVLNKLEMGIL